MSHRSSLPAALLILLALIGSFGASPQAAIIILPSATITVTSAADNMDVDGLVTLREAILASNTNTSVDGSVSGEVLDTIVFDPSLAGSTISLTGIDDTTWLNSSFAISSNFLTIQGLASGGITIERNGGGSEMRLFYVASDGFLSLRDITLEGGVARGGNSPTSGGGGRGGGGAGMGGLIFNEGSLTIERSTLTNAMAIGGETGGFSPGSTSGTRGGHPNGGTAGSFGNPNGTSGMLGGFGGGGGGGGNGFGGTAGNGGDGGFGGGAGGGGGNSGGGGSTGSAGSPGFGGGSGAGGGAVNGGVGGGGAAFGGAIFNHGGAVTIENSTVSDNSAAGGTGASGFGGGVFNRNGSVTILNSTISNNAADDGGAVYHLGDGDTAEIDIDNSILANSSAGDDFQSNAINVGTANSAGTNNIIESETGFNGLNSTSDPMLGSLADNGGPTFTRALMAGSPAIDSGSNTEAQSGGLTVDQRGEPRFGDAITDIGAYETEAPEIEVSPASLRFNHTAVGAGPSSPETLIISNVGNADLTIISVGLSFGDVGDFAVSSDSGEGMLAPGASREVTLVYEPTTEGAHGSTLQIFSDDADEPGLLVNLGGVSPLTAGPILPGCSTPEVFTSAPSLAIPSGPAVVSDEIIVNGVGTYLWDLNIQTFIRHAANNHLDITIQSPSGTVVTLTTDNGGLLSDGFNGTLWDDQADPNGEVTGLGFVNEGLVTDSLYSDAVSEELLVPEEAFGAFIGEDPNGSWVLTISDDAAGGDGTLDSYSLILTTCDETPISVGPTTFTNSSAETIVPTGPVTVSSELVVSGLEEILCDVNLTMDIVHTFAGDLDITLRSPAGTIVTLTTDNGSGADNVFDGTVWDDDADPDGQVPYASNQGLVTDTAYVNLVPEPTLVPEEALAAFNGENPNGTWLLTVRDDAGADGGTLSQWSLDIETCALPEPDIDVMPLMLAYGDWDIDDGPTTAMIVSVENTGTGNLNFTGDGFTITGSTPKHFEFTAPPDTSALAPGMTRTVSIVFDPENVSPKARTLEITTDDPDEPTVVVDLTGTGIDQEITVLPLVVTFVEQGVGLGAGPAMDVTVANVGAAPLNFTGPGAVLGGTEVGDFAISNAPDLVTPIAPGTDRVISVTFSAMGDGERKAQLTITTDDTDEPSVVVQLEGTGAPIGPTGLTTGQIVEEILTRTTGAPASPDPYDVNMDGDLDAGDVTSNVNDINTP